MTFFDPTYSHPNVPLSSCHSMEQIAKSHYNPDDFLKVLEENAGCDAALSVPPPRKGAITRQADMDSTRSHYQPADAAYLSTVNLSKVTQWGYSLKTLPRPTGRGTRMIITEYDLPRPDAQPHDVTMGPDGMVWYDDFAKQFIGKMDPKTGKIVEYPVPIIRPGHGTGMNNFQIDAQGNVWIAMFAQAGLAKFDPKTEKFQIWPLPKEYDSSVMRTVFVEARAHDVDGKVWLGAGQEGKNFRVDLATGKWEVLDESLTLQDLPKGSRALTRPHATYSISSDSKNNLYLLDIGSEYITKIDAKTLKATFFQTPTLDSKVRRGNMDSHDRLWFANII